ncbi:gamma-aminobutyric acid type B receptor subunit 1-like isoform X2 [Asterias rubens]|uniref:gamma-aminobutyric acid type B receptor subunit 1-like isoform X2 n=1 Tax=Asterias rubens TaxID=7604 RepID=UPI001454F65D|nr:gamma-aminobutyric acid type B receptor subunit 1-like isoform X2 [Asterias rubens]
MLWTRHLLQNVFFKAHFWIGLWMLCVLRIAEAAPATTPIYLLGLYPLSGNWAGGQGQLPATRLGIKYVNAMNVLPGYELVLLPHNTECNGGKGTDVMYRELYNYTTTKIMILGGGCSLVTQATAQTSHHWNLIQLSYSSASPLLSNRQLFPMFFRAFPPETVFNVVKFAVLKHFGWTKVATLHETIDLFSLPTVDFLSEAESHGIEIIASQSFADHPSLSVSNLKKQGARIIIGNFYETRARQVFCQAYKEGMYGEKYVWIITGWYSYQWWLLKDSEGNVHDCTPDQMSEAVNGYFTTDALPLSLAEEPGIAGINTQQFLAEYKEYVGGTPEMLTGYQEAPYGFDSVWTLALALQEAETRLQKFDPPRSIANFSYEDDEMADMFFEIMNATNFKGVSGPVQFTFDGDRKGLMQVEQSQNGDEKLVGIYNPSSPNGFELEWTKDPPIIWAGGKPPADSVLEKELPQTISADLFIGMTALAIVGVVLAAGFLRFNIHYRNRRYIKMSSPKMNNLILVGGMLMYLSIVFNGLDTSRVSHQAYIWTCKANTWCMGIGFSMAFGAMFSKTWRVHKIFTSKAVMKTMIKDYQLYVMVTVLVLFILTVLILWEIVDPLQVVITKGIKQPTYDQDVVVIPVHVTCQSIWQVYWIGTLVGIEGLLLIFGAFLAWETRNVTVPALNDSKYIGISVYNIVILSFIIVPVTFILDEVNARFVIMSTFVFFATTLTLCLVFVPKLRVRNEVHPKGAMLSTKKDGDEGETEADRRIRMLHARINNLQTSLGKVRYWTLLNHCVALALSGYSCGSSWRRKTSSRSWRPTLREAVARPTKSTVFVPFHMMLHPAANDYRPTYLRSRWKANPSILSKCKKK